MGFTIVAGPLIGQIIINGKVIDQEERSLEFALIRIEPADHTLTKTRRATSDKSGDFNLTYDAPTGIYFLNISRQGFQEIKNEPRELKNGTLNLLTIQLVPIPRFEINISPDKNEISLEQIELSQTLENSQIDSSVVSRADNLLSIVRTMAGVNPDASGKIHPDGSPTDQINLLLDGFRANDPVTGQLEVKLSTEAPRSLDLFAGRYSVDLGRGETTLKIISQDGNNKFKKQITNFIPGIGTEKGLTLTGWEPKFTISGPIKKDRILFFNATGLDYSKNFVYDLPKGQDRTNIWEASNLLRVQVNLSAVNVLNSGILINYLNAPKTGLSPLNPISTTLDRRSRRYFLSLRDMIAINSGLVLTLGYAKYDSFIREIPQGHEILKLSPTGTSGNFPTDIQRWGNRQELDADLTWRPKQKPLTNHELKFGTNLNYSTYRQDSLRTGFEHFNLAGLPIVHTIFGGSGKFNLSNLENSAYLQDRWNTRIRNWPLYAEIGLRFDRDGIISHDTLTPRASIAFAPPKFKKARFSIGYGLTPTLNNLGLFGRKLDQYSLTTEFDRNGNPNGPAELTIFTSNDQKLRIGRVSNFSAGTEQNLPAGFQFRFDYLRKRSQDGLTFTPTVDLDLITDQQKNNLPETKIAVVYYLNNSKTQVYDAIKIRLKKRTETFWQKSHWKVGRGELLFSYVRSRTFSNSNISPFIDDPFTSDDGSGRTPWDIPNRFISNGAMELSENTKIFYFSEWRDGTPFSVYDEIGRQVGKFNSWRLPRYNVINLHVEHRFKLFKKIWAIRLGLDNITNRTNYIQVNPNVSAPNFPNYFGVEPRKLVIRIRWLK